MANNSSLTYEDTYNYNNNDDEGWFDWGTTNLVVDENGFRLHSTNPVIVIGLMVGLFGSFFYCYWCKYGNVRRVPAKMSLLNLTNRSWGQF